LTSFRRAVSPFHEGGRHESAQILLIAVIIIQ